MPKFRQHLIINVVALTALEVALQRLEMQRNPTQPFDWGRLTRNVGLGSVAGALPDLLEPSIGNPNHRGFCHSVAAAGVVWWIVSGRHTHELPLAVRRTLSAIGVGYSLHLGADLLLSKAKGMGLINAQL